MNLDLAQLRTMHPNLPASTALDLIFRATIGLARHGHVSGIAMGVDDHGAVRDSTLHWTHMPGDAAQLDFNRVTEDGAEAISLVLVHVLNGWVVRRRLQRTESADWLLLAPDQSKVALEVSGIDQTDTNDRRLHQKVAQVGKSVGVDLRVASVVQLSLPKCSLASA